MSTSRWDAPWTAPVGTAPERPPEEPSPPTLVVLHLGVLFALTALGSAVRLEAGDSPRAAAVAAALLWLVTGTAGWLVRRPHGLAAWLADLLLAASAGYLFGAVGTLADDAGRAHATSLLLASAASLLWALPAYAVHRRIWLQVTVVLSATGTLVSGIALQPTVPDAASGAYLVVLGGFVALGALSGVLRPVRSAAVLAALLGTAGSHVLVRSHAVGGTAVALGLLAAVSVAVLRSGNRSLLPVTVVAGVVLLPSVLEPELGLGRAVGVSLAAVAAGAAWLAADLLRRSARPAHVGGVLAVCLLLVLASYPFLLFHTRHDTLADPAHLVAVIGFFTGAAAARRRAVTVVGGLLVVAELPAVLNPGRGAGGGTLVGLGGLVAVLLVARALSGRAPAPAAAPHQQEVALSGHGREWVVVSSYPQVFDAVVSVLGGAGLPLQLVDRAAGRIIAGDAAAPVLVVAIWGPDPVRTCVRAVGAAGDVDRLERDVTARLEIGVDAPR